MTNYEMKQMADLIIEGLAERLKKDDELLERVFPSRLMNIEEASVYTGIPINTLYMKITEIPHSKVGKRLVFTERGLAKWIGNNEAKDESATKVIPIQLGMASGL